MPKPLLFYNEKDKDYIVIEKREYKNRRGIYKSTYRYNPIRKFAELQSYMEFINIDDGNKEIGKIKNQGYRLCSDLEFVKFEFTRKEDPD